MSKVEVLSDVELRLEALELRVSGMEVQNSTTRCTLTHFEGLLHAAATRINFALEQLSTLEALVRDMASLLMPIPSQLACLEKSLPQDEPVPSRRFTIAWPQVTSEQQQAFNTFCAEV